MNIARITTCVSAALLATALLPQAKADEWNQKTIFTFSAPVEIPGRVLPAGTYVFKLADSQSDRNIVEVFNKRENHLYGIFLAIPDYRLQPSGRTIITFEERAPNSPEAVKAWFYPGDNFGHEFVYPKAKALQLAKVNNETVPSMPNETAQSRAALKQAPLTAQQPNQTEEGMAQAYPPATTQAATTPPAATTPATQAPVTTAENTMPSRLPKTGSSMPLIGLIGLVSLAAAGSFRLAAAKMK